MYISRPNNISFHRLLFHATYIIFLSLYLEVKYSLSLSLSMNEYARLLAVQLMSPYPNWLAEHLRFLHVLSLTLSTMSPFNKSSLLDTNPKACMWESSVVWLIGRTNHISSPIKDEIIGEIEWGSKGVRVLIVLLHKLWYIVPF